MILKREGEF